MSVQSFDPAGLNESLNVTMTAAAALGHLERMAGDTVFQPENRHARVQLIGPLEASGAEFDAIWIAGVTAGVIVVCASGFVAARGAVNAPPVAVLRAA